MLEGAGDMPRHADRFVGLDGLRGVAAIVVLLLHVPDATFAHFLPGGYLAVDLFFMLSGFVLEHAYRDRIRDGMSLGSFMTVRMVRLYPLYILGSLIVAAISLIGAIGDPQFPISRWAASVGFAVLFVPCPPALSLSESSIFPMNFPAWSLFFELCVNVAFAVLATRMHRHLLAIVLAVGTLLLVWTAIAFGSLETGFDANTFLGGFGRVIFPFFCGCGLYRLYSAGIFDRWTIPSWLPFAALMITFALSSSAFSRSYIDIVTVILIFPVITLSAAIAAPSGLLERACLIAGTASYAVYVLQVPIMTVLGVVSRRATGQELEAFGIFGAMAIVVVALRWAVPAVPGATLNYVDARVTQRHVAAQPADLPQVSKKRQ